MILFLIILLSQNFFVCLQPNLDKFSIEAFWIASLTRCKTVTPLSAGSKKAEDCSKRGTSRRKSCKTYSCQSKRRPAFVCWKQRKRLLTLVIRCFETWEISFCRSNARLSRCSWVYHTLMRTLFLRCACVWYSRVGFCMFIRRYGFPTTSKHG